VERSGDGLIISKFVNLTHKSMSNEIPEGCKLIAHHTGDGWYLAVQDTEGNDIAILDWPDSWPEEMTTEQLRIFGFEIV